MTANCPPSGSIRQSLANKFGSSLFHSVVLHEMEDIVNPFLENGADLEMEDCWELRLNIQQREYSTVSPPFFHHISSVHEPIAARSPTAYGNISLYPFLHLSRPNDGDQLYKPPCLVRGGRLSTEVHRPLQDPRHPSFLSI